MVQGSKPSPGTVIDQDSRQKPHLGQLSLVIENLLSEAKSRLCSTHTHTHTQRGRTVRRDKGMIFGTADVAMTNASAPFRAASILASDPSAHMSTGTTFSAGPGIFPLLCTPCMNQKAREAFTLAFSQPCKQGVCLALRTHYRMPGNQPCLSPASFKMLY
jgi:hypothetical protein